MKRYFLFLLALAISLAGTGSALADDDTPPCTDPPCVYVDPEHQPSGNETGHPDYPYSEYEEGEAMAQSLDGGGWLYYKDPASGNWVPKYISEADPRNFGAPLPSVAMYLLLGIFALILILAGRQLQRRSRQL